MDQFAQEKLAVLGFQFAGTLDTAALVTVPLIVCLRRTIRGNGAKLHHEEVARRVEALQSQCQVLDGIVYVFSLLCKPPGTGNAQCSRPSAGHIF